MPTPTTSNALLRNQRRAANRKQRQGGHAVIGHFELAKLQRVATADIAIRAELTRLGPIGRPAKKALGIVQVTKQFDRQGLAAFWNPEGTRHVR